MNDNKGYTGLILPWDKSAVLIVPNGTVATTRPPTEIDKLVLWQADRIIELEKQLLNTDE